MVDVRLLRIGDVVKLIDPQNVMAEWFTFQPPERTKYYGHELTVSEIVKIDREYYMKSRESGSFTWGQSEIDHVVQYEDVFDVASDDEFNAMMSNN